MNSRGTKRFVSSLLSLTFVFAGVASMAQTDSISVVKTKKNAVYPTISFFILIGSASLNYERVLCEFNRIKGRVALKASYGKIASWEYTADMYQLTPILILGNKANHFEVQLGVSHLVSHWDGGIDTYPNIGLGYRYQKPGRPFVFRLGASWPETFYMSLGVAF